ncbi:hypothetical protein DM40_5713 [Burkholderia cenocepacia]|nr:hypothetical protein DM40_5713 [Burkholderia cenocepacia]
MAMNSATGSGFALAPGRGVRTAVIAPVARPGATPAQPDAGFCIAAHWLFDGCRMAAPWRGLAILDCHAPIDRQCCVAAMPA